MKYVASSEFDYSVWFDYDSFCLDPAPELPSGARANVGVNQEPWRFLAATYFGPPWLMPRHSLCALLHAGLQSPIVFEEGFTDRLLGVWSHLGNVPIQAHNPPGFWKTEINISELDNLDHALADGAIWIHGVRSAIILKHILEFKR